MTTLSGAPLTRNVPLSTQIADQLRTRIAGGEFPVGSRLPAEAALAAQLGVSRGSVREATRALVHSGLLSARPGDGTYVCAESELAPALGRRAERCRSDDVTEVRSLLEQAMARYAAERADGEQLAAIRRALDDRNASVEAAGFVAGDLRFHRAIADASGNALLAELYRGLDDIPQHLESMVPTGPGFREYRQQTSRLEDAHAELCLALESRDPDRAESLARELVAESHLQPEREGRARSDAPSAPAVQTGASR